MNIRITEKDIEAVAQSLRDGELSGRSEVVKRFELAFAAYVGADYAVSCNSGASALFLALRAVDVAGQTVVCPAFGYIAVPNAIRQAGGMEFLVDVERDTGNIIPDADWPSNTQAAIVIDTYGHACDYDTIKKCHPGVVIIEDAAEALGGEYKGKKLGALPQADMTCFSLFANKVITTGEGGMITTNNPEYAKLLYALRDQFTTDKKYYHEKLGYKLCMPAMCAALGLSQLSRIDEILAEKKERAEELAKYFKSWSWVTKPYAKHSHWVFPMTVDLPGELIQAYDDARPFFWPYHLQPEFKQFGAWPNAEWLHEHGVYLLT